jgi:hypothetical protein
LTWINRRFKKKEQNSYKFLSSKLVFTEVIGMVLSGIHLHHFSKIKSQKEVTKPQESRFHHFSKIKNQKEVTKPQESRFFLLHIFA